MNSSSPSASRASAARLRSLVYPLGKRHNLLLLFVVLGLALIVVVGQTSAPLTVVFDEASYLAVSGRVWMRTAVNKPASALCTIVNTSSSVNCPPGINVTLALVPCSGPFLVRVDATAGDETASAWAVVQCTVPSSTSEAQTATQAFTESSPLEAAPALNVAAQTQAVATETAGVASHKRSLEQADTGPTATLKPDQLSAPSGLRVSAKGLVSWNRVASADKYQIAIQTRSSSAYQYIEVTKDEGSYHLPDSDACCNRGTSYRVWLIAVDTSNAANNSPWSSRGAFTYDPAGRSGRSPSSKADRNNLAIPTQDHSRLPEGGQVKSETPWIQFYEIPLWRIGDQSIVAAGAKSAIDVWGPLGVDAEVCFGDIGSLLFLDAAFSPRKQYPLLSYLRDGMTCAHLYTAGTLVLMPGSPSYAPTPNASPRSAAGDQPHMLANCKVTLTEYLNFRKAPNGELISLPDGLKNQLPAKVTLTALERTTDWFKVDWYGVKGWISAHYVTPRGDCE